MILASCTTGEPESGVTVNVSRARAPGVAKVLVDKNASSRAQPAASAVVGEIDYGGFRLLLVDEQAAGGRTLMANQGLQLRDDMNRVPFEGWQLDTRRPADVESLLPAAERRDELTRARAEGRAPKSGLYVVQFVGPVRDAWLANLAASGLEVVSYVPENAYVVRARGHAAAELLHLDTRYPEVQFVGDFHPAYRLAAALRPVTAARASGPVEVVVQVVDGDDAAANLADLRSFALGGGREHRVLKFRNVEMTVDSARLQELAAREYVFHVEERLPRQRLDEAQGQIVAGNLSGNSPTGPGYLGWLDGKGFNASQFAFSVNVVDDAYTLSGHPDLPSSRIAFVRNPTAQTGALGGHGFLNANIVGGFNNSTGAAFEDANGFNYGLGIAPYVRVGATAIFGNGTSTPTAWESEAYGLGARVSTNSWGFTGAAAKKYDTNAQEYDVIVRDAQTSASGLQQLAVVFAAGNDGSAANTVSSPGTAKNVITVGAGENVRQTGTDGCAVPNSGADSANDVIDFSSRGPVNSAGGDGRIKPDIMAPGTHVEAGVPQSNYDGSSVCNQFFPAGQTLYGWSSGTSHSCPAVAGAAALVYQDFLNKGRPAPSPAMVKAYLMNSATRMTGVGANDTLPSNNQGMGRADLTRAFDTVPRVLVDQTQILGATGQTHTVTGTVSSATQPFRVTLGWTDAAGPTTGAPWVNNLDLEVTVGGNTYRGNVFSGGSSITGGTADTRNNVESVVLPAGVSGSFTVTVRATNIAGDGVPGNADTTDQDFALIIYNGTAGTPTPTIGISPSSLSFSATAGGANPPSQALAISNTGGGTLNWTASSNQPWLLVAPTSGSAPSTANVSVNTSGLAAGTYSGAISIAATGASNSPVSVPVTLTVTNPMPNPTIGVSPSSFSFSATAGGANPPNQTLTISNSGGGTLNWTVSDNASWLSLLPTAGTAPSSTTLSVNSAGLAAGTYNGVITVAATGATNTPVTVPVTLTLSPPTGTELIVNGGFEGSASPWVLSGDAFFSTGGLQHGGTGYSIVGFYDNANGNEYQTVTIPSAATTANLSFWLNVTSSETTTVTQYDRLFVEVRSSTGTLLATLATFSNLNKATAGAYTQRGPFSLLAFKGQTVRVQFRAINDFSLPTAFRIDDVSLK